MRLIDAENAVLDQRTAAPCCVVVHGRPAICSLAEDVLRIEERKPRVHIEQVPLRSVRHPDLSSGALTISDVTLPLSGWTGESRMPFRLLVAVSDQTSSI